MRNLGIGNELLTYNIDYSIIHNPYYKYIYFLNRRKRGTEGKVPTIVQEH